MNGTKFVAIFVSASEERANVSTAQYETWNEARSSLIEDISSYMTEDTKIIDWLHYDATYTVKIGNCLYTGKVENVRVTC